ncbi:hypothetical protein C8R45DRAFT_1138184 [Mycena sanguinolenta]|nr:hypothetical protein C8R45DRAFT_1138184 [Mycena sanguinolenta]
MAGKRKAQKRVPKESRQNLRLWAEGVHETQILAPHIEAYGDALERRWRAERECLQKICNKFHAKVSWRLADHEEPPLPLPDYDSLADEPEGQEELSEDNQVAKRQRIAALNDFMREKYKEEVAPVVAERWAESVSEGSNLQTKKDPDGPFRAKVAREVFRQLDQDEQDAYAARAKEEAADVQKKFDEDLKKAPSKTPEDRQACIDCFGAFLGPILQGIYERTGLHSTIIMGGPILNYGGDLKSVFVSYGRTRNGAAHFPEWAKDRGTLVTDLMKEYLGVAFSKQDQVEASLPDDLLAGAKYTIDSLSDHGDEGSSSEPQKKKERWGAKKGGGLKAAGGSGGATDGKATAKTKRTSAMESSGAKSSGTKSSGGKSSGGKPRDEGTVDGVRKRKRVEKGDEENSRGLGKTQGKGKKRGREEAGKEDEGEDDTRKKKKRRGEKEDAAATKTPPAPRARRSTRLRGDLAAADGAGDGTSAVTAIPPVPGVSGSTSGTTSTGGNVTQATPTPAPTETAHASSSTETPAAGATPSPGTPARTPPAPNSIATTSTMTATPTATQGAPPPSVAAPVASPTPTQTPTATQGAPPPSAAALAALVTPPLPSVPIEMPADAPTWIVQSVTDLTQSDLGCHFAAVLVALVRLETAAGYEAGHVKRLPGGKALTRPKVIGEWIKGRRGTKSKTPPSISDVAAHVAEWDEWWDKIQPEWRLKDVSGKWRIDVAYEDGWDWGSLGAMGVNGLVSAVAALYFWGVAVRMGTQAQISRWEDSVHDVAWVLEGVERTLL